MNNKLKLLMASLCLTLYYFNSSVNAENIDNNINDIDCAPNPIGPTNIVDGLYNDLVSIVKRNWEGKKELEGDIYYIMIYLNGIKNGISSGDNERIEWYKQAIVKLVNRMVIDNKISPEQVEIWKRTLDMLSRSINDIANNKDVVIGTEICNELTRIVEQHWIDRQKLYDDGECMLDYLNNLKKNIIDNDNETINIYKQIIMQQINTMYRQGKILDGQVMVWQTKLNEIEI